MEPWTGSQSDPSTELIVTWGVRIVLGILFLILLYGLAHKPKPSPKVDDDQEDH